MNCIPGVELLASDRALCRALLAVVSSRTRMLLPAFVVELLLYVDFLSCQRQPVCSTVDTRVHMTAICHFVPAIFLSQLLETIDTSTPRDERGDLLVFLSGMGDMLAVTEGVREYVEAKSPRRWVVLMLHSSLSVEEQDKVRCETQPCYQLTLSFFVTGFMEF